MKSINIMAAAAVLALTGAGVASAQTVIRVTGSSAFRASVVAAECNIAGGTNASSGSTVKAVYYGSSKNVSNSNYSVIYGTTYTFENAWTGSIAGFEAVSDNGTQKPNFPLGNGVTPASVTVYNLATPANEGGGASTSASSPSGTDIDTNHTADIALSDVSSSTASAVTALYDAVKNTPNEITASGQSGIGIIPFVFMINASTDVLASRTNILSGLSMDPQKFTYAYSSGTPATYSGTAAGSAITGGGSALFLSYFTGNNNDEPYFVFPMGRDVDSGTRATALVETGFGLTGSGKGAVNNAVVQYFPFTSVSAAQNPADNGAASYGSGASFCVGDDSTAVQGGADAGDNNGAIVAFQSTPAVTVANYPMGGGDSGYNSGGNLAQALSTQNTLSGSVVLGYLGVSDSQVALNSAKSGSGAGKPYSLPTVMAYNGSTFDPTVAGYSNPPSSTNVNQAKIYEGQYTYWGVEHLFVSNSTKDPANATVAQTVGGLLVGQLYGTGNKAGDGIDVLAANGVSLNFMQVSRNSDGGNIQ